MKALISCNLHSIMTRRCWVLMSIHRHAIQLFPSSISKKSISSQIFMEGREGRRRDICFSLVWPFAGSFLSSIGVCYDCKMITEPVLLRSLLTLWRQKYKNADSPRLVTQVPIMSKSFLYVNTLNPLRVVFALFFCRVFHGVFTETTRMKVFLLSRCDTLGCFALKNINFPKFLNDRFSKKNSKKLFLRFFFFVISTDSA